VPNRISVEYDDGRIEEYSYPTPEEIQAYKKKYQSVVDYFDPDKDAQPLDPKLFPEDDENG
jgi:hypothetical protein